VYQFGKKLGNGTYGHVYSATRISDQKLFAVKSIKLEKMKESGDIKMLEQELEILRTKEFTAHPNLLSVEEIYMEEGKYHFVS